MSRSPTRSVLSALSAGLLALAGLAISGTPAHAATLNLTQYVNPFIGTDDSNAPNPVPGGAGGSTFPGAEVPFGMVQFSPDTPTASPSGYRSRDTSIEDFSLTHFDGAGCPNNEDLNLLPVTGSLSTSPGTGWTSYASGYTKANESAAAGYYKTRLDKYSTTVELTATTRTGVARLTYPGTTSAQLLINTSRSATGSRSGSVTVSGSTVTGNVTAGGFCGSSKTYPIYFAIQFDRAPSAHGTWSGGTVSAGSGSTSGTNTGAYVTFDTTSNPTVQATVALSYVSVAGAQANLAAETGAFDTVRANANTTWNTMLNRIQVSGGATADLQKFYTALYHVFQSPNVASDTNGQYSGFDHATHTASGMTVYQNYSGWDIYRSWAALVAFVAPDVMTDVVKSMVLDGQQGGLLPKWSQENAEDFVMTGDPGPIIVDSAYQFGVRNFDTAAALSLMDKSSNGGTAQGSPIRGRESGYLSRHYVIEDPSDSLEYSASDFAIAQFAKALGNTTLYNTYSARAQWWQNTFNPDSSYVSPHSSDGSWAWPVNPASNSGYTEGNPAQYTWMVTYDFSGLINLMGGAQTAVQRLNHHFTQVNGGLTTPYFYIGNEPEHGVPWAYNFAGDPAGTADAVHKVMSQGFNTAAGGLPGNDDLGATSAWYVWAALGMYPATPGADTLALHGPSFPSILIQRAAGNVNITASGSGSYVQSLSVNGSGTTHNYLRYPDLAAGGTLAYTMGGSPSSWGTGASDVPPSFTDGAAQPPAAPNLGTNLAAGKATTASTACSSTEGSANAVDGSLANNSKWCSTVAGASLTVDLGSAQNVGAFVVKHAGLGGETTGWNTGGYTIATSTDNSTWSTAATVTGSRASRTYNPIATRSARYVRLTANTPTNNGNNAARIYELEVYGPGSGGSGTRTGAITGLAGKCVDVANSGTTNGTHIQLYGCNNTGAQQWTVNANGTLSALGKCMDVPSSGTANGILIQLYDCNASAAQIWTPQSNGTLVNPNSGRCLDVPGSNSADGTQLEIWDCSGGANQQWHLPS
ncbi:GH92 family glycosyl hydrolase [Rugosimonospora africana]|uniref:Alpha-1,2-mannosidase n=1 Tax=Rugosimonospora africana TaxID=556532 RepID=A0A8J3VT88_9ACTN|nr:GH92 family glycosyl hydrolase [Rugosimonospora africana]GIH17396.1 alpha-1,2-mannosidase [Rugosimonospora africana]